MTPQPTTPHASPDARIDQVLEALRTAEAPNGLEQRVAARIAQAAEALQTNATQASTLTTTDNSAAPSLFAVILSGAPEQAKRVEGAQSKDPRILFAEARLYTLAAAIILLLTLTTLAILHHRTPTTAALATPAIRAQSGVPHLRDGIIVAKVGIARSATVIPSFEEGGLQSRHNIPTRNPALAAEGISHPRPTSTADPDTIALAETLAPSHPAPPMPLTSQERLMLAATRPGQPIQVAELDIARAPFLHAAAEAQEKENIQRYVRTLLAPFAVADELSPTKFSQPQEINTQAPAPQPPTSLSN